MMRFLFMLLLPLLLAAPAEAAKIRYYEDPLYRPIAPGDEHPMGDMIQMAKDGDVRAQYILGDLYQKGKGGFKRNTKTARQWFEKSAHNGFAQSFVRLAALAKAEKKPVEAYQWYTLAAARLPYGDARDHAQAARENLKSAARLTPEEISRAEQAARDWQEKMDSARAARLAEQKAQDEKKKEKENAEN